MDAKEKLAALKAGKRVTTSTGKTTTTTKGSKTTTTTKGWRINTGTQKKTVKPHKASPPSTAGKTKTYAGGKSTVVDLGHSPTKSAISTATTKLRKAKAVAKPKAKKNTASTAPTLKVPQEGAPTTPAPKTSTGIPTAAKVLGVIGTVGAGTVLATKLLKKAKAPTSTAKPPTPKQLGPGYEHAKPVGKIEPKPRAKPMSQLKLPVEQKGLPGRPKRVGLPKPQLGLPGPEKPTKRQIVDDLRAKSAPKVAKVTPPTDRRKPTAPRIAGEPTSGRRNLIDRPAGGDILEVRGGPAAPKRTTRRSIDTPKAIDGVPKGTGPKVAKVTPPVEAPKKPATVKVQGVEVSAADLADQRPKNVVRTTMDITGKRTTKVTAGKKMETVQAEADRRISEERRQGARRDRATRQTKAEAAGQLGERGARPTGTKTSSRRKAGQRRGTPKAPSATTGFGASEADIKKVATSGQTTAPPTAEQKLANAKAVEAAPKEVKDMVAEIDKATEKPGRLPTHPQMGGLAADQKGKMPPVVRGVTYKEPKAKAPDPELAKELEAARAENVQLRGVKPAKVEAPKEPMRQTGEVETRAAAGDLRGVNVPQPAPPTAEQAEAARKTRSERSFRRQQGKARRAAKDAAVAEKGIATIPTDPRAVTDEEAKVKERALERDLLDATLAEDRGRKPVEAKAVGAVGDKRTAADMFGKEAVAEKTRKIDPAPRPLEPQMHEAGRGGRTIADLVNQDQDARDARDEEIRRAASKARNIAASRDATPEQEAKLEKAIAGEYDKSLELYFDDVEPYNQRGPRKADAPPRIMDSMIDADAALTRERGSAMPPAPADRTTIEQKIKMVEERAKPGGEAIYQPKKTLEMLRNIRDTGRATPAPLKRSTAIPPQADLVTEQFAKDRPSIRAARREGLRAGERAATEKKLSGKPGPVKVPDMTKPGVIPAGPTTPPAEPAKERGVVRGPPKTMAQLWAGRMADWGRSAYQAQVKRLTSDFLDVAGEKAKATGKAEAKVRASKVGKIGKIGGTLGAATIAFAGLGAGEAAAKEHDPKKRAGAAGEQFKADLPEVGKGIVKFTAADYGVTKVIPEAVKKAATTLGAKATQSAFAAGLTKAAGRGLLAGYIGYHAIPFTGKKLAELAHSFVEAKKAGGEATEKKRKSEAKYGTVERATRTRHAKEAEKRRKAKEKR